MLILFCEPFSAVTTTSILFSPTFISCFPVPIIFALESSAVTLTFTLVTSFVTDKV